MFIILLPSICSWVYRIGPNTITGYTSVLFCNEVQVSIQELSFVEFWWFSKLEYIMKMIKPVIERSVLSFELTYKANRDYNTKLQARFTNSVFTLCASWYRLNKNGRVISIFPGDSFFLHSVLSLFLIIFLGSTVRFWWWCRRVNWSHYKVVAVQGVQWKKPSTFENSTVLVVSAYLITFLVLAVWQIGGAWVRCRGERPVGYNF